MRREPARPTRHRSDRGRRDDCCGVPANATGRWAALPRGCQVQGTVEADLFEEIGPANGGFERGQAELREQDLQVAGELFEETGYVLGPAAEFGAQLGLLRGYAGGTGIEVALPGHVAAKSDENRGAEGVLVGSEQSGDDDVAGGAKASVATQADAAPQTIL